MTDQAERTILELVDADKDKLTVLRDTLTMTAIPGLMLVVNDRGGDLSPGENAVILDREMVRKLTSAMLTWLHTGDGT